MVFGRGRFFSGRGKVRRCKLKMDADADAVKNLGRPHPWLKVSVSDVESKSGITGVFRNIMVFTICVRVQIPNISFPKLIYLCQWFCMNP